MITTDTKYKFTKAESELFSWNIWDGTNGSTLTHKPSGRNIYQMHWLNERGEFASDVEGETRIQALAFWGELRNMQDQPEPIITEETEAEPRHGENGYCRYCQSWCYGDCQAH